MRPARRLVSLRFPVRLLCTLLLLLSVDVAPVAAQDDGPLISSTSYAAFGRPKYAPGFTHFDYVNPDAPKGGTYRYANTGSFDSLNLMNLLGTAPLGLVVIYDSLMRRAGDEPAARYPLVARSITYPRDLAWMEFHLDPRARWHDGRPITPEDVIFTIDQAKGLVTPALKRVQTAVARTQKTGPRSVRIYFTAKNSPSLPTTVMDMWLLPAHYYRTHNIMAASLDRPLASGPYKIGKFSAGRWIEFERVRDYWARDLPVNKGRHNFDILRQDYYRDGTVANEAFLAGNSDLKFESSAQRWDTEARMPVFRSGQIKRELIPYSNASLYVGIVMNTRRAFLADRQVRRALMLAYDFEWSRRVLLKGHHGRITNFFTNSEFASRGLPSGEELKLLETVRDKVPPELFTRAASFPIGGSWTNRRANIVAAAEILRSAGYRIANGRLLDRRDQPVTLNLVSYSPLMDRQVSLFIENARQLGIAVNYRSFDTAQFRQRLRNYDYDLLLNAPMFAGYETPSYGMTLMWGSKAADTPQQFNYPGVRNPAADAMLSAMLTARNRETTVAAMRALDRILLWNYYAIPMHHIYPAPIGQMPVTYWDRFGHPARQPTYNFSFTSLDTWWLDPVKDARITQGRYQ
ncbi:extracellular solute-binding protein [Sphingobium sp. H33]|uniref:Extracellular solute-binding protein n=2 Tax=Sphingobium nicotianae TaxID=2782607 RepID=A0A9X1IRU2_9SPHN|nr:extracellular solute-binding protein [Sphingobium nicotianae]